MLELDERGMARVDDAVVRLAAHLTGARNAVINLLAPVRHVVGTTGVYRTSTLARWLRDVWCRSARPERTTGHTGLPLAM